MSIDCPSCGKEGRVVDTRRHGKLRWRRRECSPCDQRWSTWEVGGDDETRQLLERNNLYREVVSDIRAALGRLIENQKAKQ